MRRLSITKQDRGKGDSANTCQKVIRKKRNYTERWAGLQKEKDGSGVEKHIGDKCYYRAPRQTLKTSKKTKRWHPLCTECIGIV